MKSLIDGDLDVVGILVTLDDLVLPTGEAVQLQVTGLLPSTRAGPHWCPWLGRG